MDSSFLFTLSTILNALVSLGLAAVLGGGAFLALQASKSRPDRAPLRFVAAGLGGMAAFIIAGMAFTWVLRTLLSGSGGTAWGAYQLVVGVGGTLLDAVCAAAIGYGLFQLKDS